MNICCQLLSGIFAILLLTFTTTEAARIPKRTIRGYGQNPHGLEDVIIFTEDSSDDGKTEIMNVHRSPRKGTTNRPCPLPGGIDDCEKYDSDEEDFDEDEIEEEEGPLDLKIEVSNELGTQILKPIELKKGPTDLEPFGYAIRHPKNDPPEYIRCDGTKLTIPQGARALLITIPDTGKRQTNIQINHYLGVEIPTFRKALKQIPNTEHLPIFVQIKDQPKSPRSPSSNTTPRTPSGTPRQGRRPDQPRRHAPIGGNAFRVGRRPPAKKFTPSQIEESLSKLLKEQPKPKWPAIQVAIHHDGANQAQEINPLEDQLIKSQGSNKKLKLDNKFFQFPVPDLSSNIVAIRLANGSILFPSDLWASSKTTINVAPSVLLEVPYIKEGNHKRKVLFNDIFETDMKLMKRTPQLSIQPICGSHIKIFLRYVQVEVEDESTDE